jgi:hypothetical protein
MASLKFKIKKKLPGRHFSSIDRLCLLLTPLRFRWAIPLSMTVQYATMTFCSLPPLDNYFP